MRGSESRTRARSDLPLSLRIIGRPSWPGALFIAVCAVLFVWGLPQIAATLPPDETVAEPATRTIMVESPGTGTVVITLADGWDIADESATGEADTVTLVNAGATLDVSPPRDLEGRSLDAILADATQQFADDPAAGWVISEPVEFTTDAGDPGMCVTSSTTADLQFSCAVTHDDLYVTYEAQSTTATWPSLQDGASAMVNSTVITGVQS